MTYQVVTTAKFDRSFRKLDRQTQRILKSWIDKNLVDGQDPRAHGKALTADRRGQWRYRVGDYRILADIQDTQLILVLVSVGHRSKVYRAQWA